MYIVDYSERIAAITCYASQYGSVLAKHPYGLVMSAGHSVVRPKHLRQLIRVSNFMYRNGRPRKFAQPRLVWWFGRILRLRRRVISSEFASSSESKNSPTIQAGNLPCSRDILLD
jgi:hypothetical protein